MKPQRPRAAGLILVSIALVLVLVALLFSDRLGPVTPVLIAIAVFNIVRGGLWLLRRET